jgi:hypothetical protein
MPNRFVVACLLFALLGAGLACSLPGLEQVDYGIVTESAPTLAPSPLPPLENTPAPPSEEIYEGSAVKTSYGSGDVFCSVTQAYTLRVQSDGSAKLTTTGPSFIDHYNCTSGDTPETWMIEGVFNAGEATVNFETCNEGRFSAAGSVNLAGGNPVGTVRCANKEGIVFISLQIGP